MTASDPQTPTRRPWTVRVAAWSAAHRWPVFGLWFLLTIGTFAASLAAGGTRAVDAVSRDQRAKYESTEANLLYSDANVNSGPAAPASQSFVLLVTNRGGTVTDPAGAAAIKDIVARLGALQSTVDGATGPVFTNLVDPTTLPPAAGLFSPDQTTVRIAGQVLGDGIVITERLEPVPAAIDAIRAAYPGYEIHALNNALANDEISELITGGLDKSLVLTIPITFAILLIAFGAVVAAVVPLVLAVTALLAAFGVLALYSQYVSAVSPYASQLVVLIGLAVAVDYSLFMVTRFRTERRHGRSKLAAIDASSSTAGRAVFFSGLAVTISIGGLFLLDDPLFRSMAIGTIAVVLISVVGSLTFLPATLAILGDGVSRFRIPIIGRDRPEGSGLWAGIVRAVMRQPIVSFAVTAAALLALATPVTRLHLGTADFQSFPDTLDVVQAVNLLNEKYPAGEGVGIDFNVVVTRADEGPTKDAISRMSDGILAIAGMTGGDVKLASDGKTASVNYKMPGDPNDQHNQDIVRQVRASIIPSAFSGIDPGVRKLVTGDAAYTLDVVDFYAHGMPIVALFVLGLSFVLLLVAFRSIVIPIKAILLNLLSTGTAFGLMVVVFQEGFLNGPLGFKPGPVESFVPVFIFTILFGLSMDYHVFILTRIKEARDHGLSSNEAVARGISITSGTITSAAAIMVCVFAVFVTLPLTIIKQLGFGLAVAVFIDATVVRSVLLPATMRLLGEWNWWLPRWLGWLPQVTIEGHVDETAERAPEPAVAFTGR
ncbi:MAG TPA: MMPL family transporter [Candidatus Limnocylindrales bacterium]|nr:MMPL family transporter [Candidatus Limnocylindrales bacterium]